MVIRSTLLPWFKQVLIPKPMAVPWSVEVILRNTVAALIGSTCMRSMGHYLYLPHRRLLVRLRLHLPVVLQLCSQLVHGPITDATLKLRMAERLVVFKTR